MIHDVTIEPLQINADERGQLTEIWRSDWDFYAGDDQSVTTSEKIGDSLLGRGTTVGSAVELLPEGRCLVVGENSNIRL